jgi:hypothetical protein
MATETVEQLKCYLCGKPIPADQVEDLKCYGCGYYFHDRCMLDKRDIPLGKHTVFLHEELEDEDDE